MKTKLGLIVAIARDYTMERVTAAAVESAASRNANYVNAFKDAEVAFYRCAKLPPVGQK
jgi:hypothetical protein